MHDPSKAKTDAGRTELRVPPELATLHHRAIELRSLVSGLVPRPSSPALHVQLERASLGVVMGITEGSRRTCAKDRIRFLEMARGNLTKSAAALDVLRTRGLADPRRLAHARALAARLIPMLVRLCEPRSADEQGQGARRRETRQGRRSFTRRPVGPTS